MFVLAISVSEATVVYMLRKNEKSTMSKVVWYV